MLSTVVNFSQLKVKKNKGVISNVSPTTHEPIIDIPISEEPVAGEPATEEVMLALVYEDVQQDALEQLDEAICLEILAAVQSGTIATRNQELLELLGKTYAPQQIMHALHFLTSHGLIAAVDGKWTIGTERIVMKQQDGKIVDGTRQQIRNRLFPKLPIPDVEEIPSPVPQRSSPKLPMRHSHASVQRVESWDERLLKEDIPISLNDYATMYTHFKKTLESYVLHLIGNQEQAYDIVQDVFVKAYKFFAKGKTIPVGALSSWLYKIATRTTIDVIRRKKLINLVALSIYDEDRGAGSGVVHPDRTKDFRQDADDNGALLADGYKGNQFEEHIADNEIFTTVLGKLSHMHAECLLLSEFHGYSHDEIAEILHVSVSAVKMRLMRAKDRFIELYQKEISGIAS